VKVQPSRSKPPAPSSNDWADPVGPNKGPSVSYNAAGCPACGIFFSSPNVHPTLLLVLWICVVILAQKSPATVLVPILCGSAILCSSEARSAWLGLVNRSRWLLAVLVATTVLMIPGESVCPGCPITEEGLQFAGEQLLRLLFILFAVAWLITRWPAKEFTGAICGIASRAGFSAARRAAVRLALTLQVIGKSDRSRPLWREFLNEVTDPSVPPQELQTISFEDPPFGNRDRIGLVMAIAATVLLWWVLP
jgi:hypothetical protein